jgi:hypothetical protein
LITRDSALSACDGFGLKTAPRLENTSGCSIEVCSSAWVQGLCRCCSFHRPNSDQAAVTVAGIGRGGTVAAGEFLVDTNRMNALSKHIPKDWNHKNIEVILKTQIIEGRSGPPRIAAVHVW